eukprot:7297750-Pyramimonas_sp.AAC.1
MATSTCPGGHHHQVRAGLPRHLAGVPRRQAEADQAFALCGTCEPPRPRLPCRPAARPPPRLGAFLPRVRD